jgi:arylsulfatase A-like enzyme
MNIFKLITWLTVVAASILSVDAKSGTKKATKSTKPNIILLLSDDQDARHNSLDFMPLVKKHLIDEGTLYKNHFVTTAICCPSRVSILRGQFAHNTNFTDVWGPGGMFSFSSNVVKPVFNTLRK